MENNKKHVPDYEISTYNKQAPKDVNVIEKVQSRIKGGANEHSSSSNQQR